MIMPEQKRNYATKKMGNTECDPLWNMADIKNVVEWFEKRNEWDGYLITLLEMLLGRRIGDTISLKWSDFYFENGKQKQEMNTVIEQKTDKTTPLAISSMVFEALGIFAEHKKIKPMEHFNEEIFDHASKQTWRRVEKLYFENGRCTLNMNHTVVNWKAKFGKDWSGDTIRQIEEDFAAQKGKKSRKYGTYDDMFAYLHYVVDLKNAISVQTDYYRQRLKEAVRDCEISYNVSTHSLRKTFAYWIYTTHPFDPNCVYSLQKMFNHESIQQTLDYAGVTKIRNRKYLEDHGDFIRNVLAGKGDEIVKNMPVISLKSDDLGQIFLDIIRGIENGMEAVEVYQMAINAANEKRVM